MPLHPPLRTRVRVIRTAPDGTTREFPSVAFAYRQLLGTTEELGRSEHQRMRTQLRVGQQLTDRHGFKWHAVNVSAAASAVADAFAWTDFTFGVELEVMVPQRRFPTTYEMARALMDAGFGAWRAVHDGSLSATLPNTHGMEIVSPVLKGAEGLAALKGVCDFLKSNGCSVNVSCGMHVHIGVRGLQPVQVRRVACAFVNNEHNFDSIVPTSRRNGNRYCQSNAARVTSYTFERLCSANSISRLGESMNGGNSAQHYNSYRYFKLNFQSFVHHGTIEFRQHAGTVESEKACAWVRLIAGFCAAAINRPQQCVRADQSFESFVEQCTDEAGRAFFTARRAAFAARVAA